MNATETKKLQDRLDISERKQADSMLKSFNKMNENFLAAMAMFDKTNAHRDALVEACFATLTFLRESGACDDPDPGTAANKLRAILDDAIAGKAKEKKRGDGNG